jgi:hypothetical protein
MPLQPHADSRNHAQSVQLTTGIALGVLAFLMHGGFWGLLLGGVALLAGGFFQIYEAHKGWCAIRAMGFKTPV